MRATELRDWQRRCGFATQKEAAHELGISEITYNRKLNGRAPIEPMMVKLCVHVEANSKLDEVAAAHLLDVLSAWLRSRLRLRAAASIRRSDRRNGRHA